MAEIFRKAALDRLSSPDQLDKQIKIISPMHWLAAGGVTVAVGAVILWSCLGSLPQKTEVNGILVNDGFYQGIYAESTGIVSVCVPEGGYVKKGDVIALIDSADVEKRIAEIENIITAIESITLSSENDPAISELSTLLELKQSFQNTTAIEQYQLQLQTLEAQYEAKEAEVAALKEQYKSAEAAYLNSVGNDAYNEISYNYQNAVSEAETAGSEYSACASSVNQYASQYTSALQTYGPEHQITQSALQSYDSAVAMMEEAEQKYNDAKEHLSVQQQQYEEAYKKQNAEAANTQALSNTLSEKSTLYSNAYSELISLQSNINNLKMQIETQEIADNSQNTSIEENFEKTKEALLKQYQGELESQNHSLQNFQIVATVDGYLTDLYLEDQQAVSAGSCVARINVIESEDKHVVCYVPLSQVKQLKEGMEVTMTPASVNEQEYGHMLGTVSYISADNANTFEMTRTLGDDLLVSQLQQQGASVKVEFVIEQDDESSNGYKWSNQKGESLEITTNTVISANVITERYAPITKLLPWLKEKLYSTGNSEKE